MSQEQEQNQMDQFERLLELSFLRERRKQMKKRLQFEERDIERLKRPKIEYRKGIKFQLDNSYNYDRIKFRDATQILEAKRQAKVQKIKNITMFTILIIIALAVIIYYFSK
jgi:hypothetical protein